MTYTIDKSEFLVYTDNEVIIMLVRFNIGNFLSFKNVHEFSMIAGKVRSKSSRLYEGNNIKLLKFSSIFGANASGKSNLIKSIDYAQSTILQGFRKTWNVSPFKINNADKNKASYFEFEILINDIIYAYGFEVLLEQNCFVSEWLMELHPNGMDKKIFYRDITQGVFNSDLNIKTYFSTF